MTATNETITTTDTPPTTHAIKVLLVDDQAMIGEAVRRMLLAETDILFKFCADPTKALDLAAEFKPTVILQDLVMPQIDGLTMVKNFRADARTRDVPLIVLSSKEEPKTKAEAFGLGVNDYLVKLPDKIELIARIRYHSHGYIHLLERNEAFDALKAKQEELAGELAEAADYVRSLLPAPMKGEITTEWTFLTSTSLGGDAFGYHWIDDDHFALFLLDVCGHGVGAALLSVSAMNVVISRTLPEIDFRRPESVICALNDAFPMEKQNNMYFTMWYGVYQKSTRNLTYSSGGHPPAVLFLKPGEIDSVQQLRTPGMVVGALAVSKFSSATCVIPPGAVLYLFSDGAYEVKRPDDSMLEIEDLIALLAQPKTPGLGKLEKVIADLRATQDSPHFADDVSIVELVFE